jgi:hypothetical protein
MLGLANLKKFMVTIVVCELADLQLVEPGEKVWGF